MSIKDGIYSLSKGILDSIKGIYWLFNLDSIQQKAHKEKIQFREFKRTRSPIHVNKEEPRLLKRVFQCCSLNGLVFGLSVIIFRHIVLPFLEILLKTFFSTSTNFWYWLELSLHLTFSTLWIVPLYLLSLAVNALWFQDIGTLAYRYSIGRPKGQSLSTIVADNLFSILIQLLFLIQARVVLYVPIPVVNQGLYLVHMCLFYSLYSFEYKWIQMGWALHQRLTYLETNWVYFIGFGLPLTLITWWPGDWVISGCCFSIFFPLFIISGNEADAIKWGSTRLRLFSLVVGFSNILFRKSVSQSPRKNTQGQPHRFFFFSVVLNILLQTKMIK